MDQSPFFLKQVSQTFRREAGLHGGSLLKCECGWQGPLKSATEVKRFKRDGSLYGCHYVCKREECMKILVEDPIGTPIPLVDVANKVWIGARERDEEI